MSSNTLYSCEYNGDNVLRFIDAKAIQVVVAMVPHTPAIGQQELLEQFFLVEKPRFDVTVITSVKEELKGEPEGTVSNNGNTT
jgi:hypothetical protein